MASPGTVKRQDIDKLILPKLPEVLSQKQKKGKNSQFTL